MPSAKQRRIIVSSTTCASVASMPLFRGRRLQKRQARFGRELPAPHHDHHAGGGEREFGRPQEPAEIAEREEECALTAVEMTAGIGAKPRGAMGEFVRRRGIFLLRRWCRAYHDREIIEQPVRPGEFEEGIDENGGEPDNLELPHYRRCRDAKRQSQ